MASQDESVFNFDNCEDKERDVICSSANSPISSNSTSQSYDFVLSKCGLNVSYQFQDVYSKPKKCVCIDFDKVVYILKEAEAQLLDPSSSAKVNDLPRSLSYPVSNEFFFCL